MKGRPGFSAGSVLRYNLSQRFYTNVGFYYFYFMKSFEEKIDQNKAIMIDKDDPV